jgi:hypothetical protein
LLLKAEGIHEADLLLQGEGIHEADYCFCKLKESMKQTIVSAS